MHSCCVGAEGRTWTWAGAAKGLRKGYGGKNPNPMARTQIGSDFFVLGKNMIRSGGSKCSRGWAANACTSKFLCEGLSAHALFLMRMVFLGPRVYPKKRRYSDDHSWDTILAFQKLPIRLASTWCEDILRYTEKELSDVMQPEAWRYDDELSFRTPNVVHMQNKTYTFNIDKIKLWVL